MDSPTFVAPSGLGISYPEACNTEDLLEAPGQ